MSRPALIAGIAAGIVAGIALFGLALLLVAVDGTALSGQAMAVLILVAMLGLVLDAAWLSLAVARLRGRDDGDGSGGSGRDGPEPRPPSDDPVWWRGFERDFRDYSEARERSGGQRALTRR